MIFMLKAVVGIRKLSFISNELQTDLEFLILELSIPWGRI